MTSIMPPIGLVLGNVDFSQLKYVMQPASIGADGKEIAEVAIRYGVFLNVIITFVIVAFAMFMVVKAMNTLKRKQEATPVPPPETPPQEKLSPRLETCLRSVRELFRPPE